MSDITKRNPLPAAALALLIAAAPAFGQQADESPLRSVLEGVYTAEQAERGEATFDDRCGICHSPREFSGSGFVRSWTGATIQQLYRLISTTMPYDAPGMLEGQEYVDVIAHMLRLNGFPVGEAELEAEEAVLERIRIEPDTAGTRD